MHIYFGWFSGIVLNIYNNKVLVNIFCILTIKMFEWIYMYMYVYISFRKIENYAVFTNTIVIKYQFVIPLELLFGCFFSSSCLVLFFFVVVGRI